MKTKKKLTVEDLAVGQVYYSDGDNTLFVVVAKFRAPSSPTTTWIVQLCTGDPKHNNEKEAFAIIHLNNFATVDGVEYIGEID